MSRNSLRSQIAHRLLPIVIFVTPAVITAPAMAQSAIFNSLAMASQLSPREVNPDSESEGQPYFYVINEYEYGTADEHLLAETGWEDPEGAAHNLAQQKITPIRRGRNDMLTVRVNVPIRGSGNASVIPGRQPVSGTIPAGSTFTGKDRNKNNMPDVLEDSIRKKIIELGPFN